MMTLFSGCCYIWATSWDFYAQRRRKKARTWTPLHWRRRSIFITQQDPVYRKRKTWH